MSILSSIPAEATDLIGVMGFGLYVLTYSLLTLQKISADHTMYFVMNLLAAGMVMVGLMSAFNLASALIQTFWIAMSLVGIASRLAQHRKPAAKPALSKTTRARLDAIESRVAPQFASRRRPVAHLGDGFPGIDRRGLESERRIPLRVAD